MILINQLKNLLQGDSRSKVVAQNIVASMGIKGISIMVTFMLVPLTIGYVSPKLYGIWLTLSSFLTWLCFLDIGLAQGLKTQLAAAIAKGEMQRGKELVSTTYFMLILIFVPVCIILEWLVPFVPWCQLLNVDAHYHAEIVQVMHVLLAFACLQMIVNTLVSVIAAFQKVALSNTFIPIGNLISLLIIYILTKTTPPSMMALALTLVAMPILVVILASFILYTGRFRSVAPSWRSVRRKLLPSIFSLGYKFFLINIQVVVVYQCTNLLIANISSPEDVTRYNIAYQLLGVAVMVFNIVVSPLWPAFTDAYTRKDFQWMHLTRRRMIRLFGISALLCTLIVALSPFIYAVWIGDRVSMPFAMSVFVGIYVLAHCWQVLNSTMIVGMGKVQLHTIVAVMGMLIHIPQSLFLSQYIGMYGVLLSVILLNVTYGVIYYIQASKLLANTASGIWAK